MRRISLLFLYAPLALAAYWDIKLTSDASRRYLINAQMATDAASQYLNFALTTGTPFVTVAGVGCSTCGGVSAYNQQGSTTVQNLGNSSAGVNLIGGASTSGPLIKEDCALYARNGTVWKYPQQTIIMSNQSSQVYGGQASGLFGLASGRATGNLNVSVVGGIFARRPTRQFATYGLALQPPNAKGSDNAGIINLPEPDDKVYEGDITWKVATLTSGSDTTTFEIDGWRFKTGGTTVTNSNQDLTSTVDPYYVNMFFPSQEAQLIHASVKGSSPKPANNGQSTMYLVPCDAKFSLSTIIGGRTWEVDQTLLVDKQDDGTCASNIQGWADTNNKQYLFGSAFMSSFYVLIQIANPHNNTQSDQIGFARRASPPSIVGPVVGGVVGGVGGITIISLAIFFWIRRRDQQKLKDILDAEDHGGEVGRFVESKDAQPFPFTAQPADVPPISPAALSYASTDAKNPVLPPSYDPSDPSHQQQPNPFPGHARKN